VAGSGVLFGVDGDEGQVEVAARLHDADGDFTPVGDEYFVLVPAHVVVFLR